MVFYQDSFTSTRGRLPKGRAGIMRTKTRIISCLIVILGALIVLLEAGEGLAQRGGGKGKGGFGFNPPDPSQIFSFMARGSSYIEIKNVWKGREEMELFAKRNNITSGKITQAQFTKYWEQRDQLREEVRKNGGGGPDKGGRGGRGGFDPSWLFKRYDTNGDGSLNETEISAMDGRNQEFKDNWRQWDKDKNGLISLKEFEDYLASRLQARRDQKGGDKKDEKKDADTKVAEKKDDKDKKEGDKKAEEKPSITRIEIDEVENTTVVVYRSGKLPKELPDWFTQLDTNNDGQVSMMEWLKGKRSVSEFMKMDRNDDGLLTAEEVLYYIQQNGGDAANGKGTAVADRRGKGKAGPRFGNFNGKFRKGGDNAGGFRGPPPR